MQISSPIIFLPGAIYLYGNFQQRHIYFSKTNFIHFSVFVQRTSSQRVYVCLQVKSIRYTLQHSHTTNIIKKHYFLKLSYENITVSQCVPVCVHNDLRRILLYTHRDNIYKNKYHLISHNKYMGCVREV